MCLMCEKNLGELVEWFTRYYQDPELVEYLVVGEEDYDAVVTAVFNNTLDLLFEACEKHIRPLATLATYMRWWVAFWVQAPAGPDGGCVLTDANAEQVCPCCIAKEIPWSDGRGRWERGGDVIAISECRDCPYQSICDSADWYGHIVGAYPDASAELIRKHDERARSGRIVLHRELAAVGIDLPHDLVPLPAVVATKGGGA